MTTGYAKRIKKSKVRAIICGNKVEVINYEKWFFWNFDPKRRDYSRGNNEERRKDSILRTQIKIRNIIDCNIGEERIKFLTLTFAKNITDISEAMFDWNVFIKKMRYRYGHIEYLTVIEFQKRGAVHFHGLYFDLPLSVLNERETRGLAKLWGWGFVDVILSDGDHRISTYLSKYMLKASGDKRLLEQKAYVCSRNIKRSVTSTGMVLMTTYLDEIIGVDTPCQVSRSYDTVWLGRCDYKLFNTKIS